MSVVRYCWLTRSNSKSGVDGSGSSSIKFAIIVKIVVVIVVVRIRIGGVGVKGGIKSTGNSSNVVIIGITIAIGIAITVTAAAGAGFLLRLSAEKELDVVLIRPFAEIRKRLCREIPTIEEIESQSFKWTDERIFIAECPHRFKAAELIGLAATHRHDQGKAWRGSLIRKFKSMKI